MTASSVRVMHGATSRKEAFLGDGGKGLLTPPAILECVGGVDDISHGLHDEVQGCTEVPPNEANASDEVPKSVVPKRV